MPEKQVPHGRSDEEGGMKTEYKPIPGPQRPGGYAGHPDERDDNRTQTIQVPNPDDHSDTGFGESHKLPKRSTDSNK